jgi:hypothetical protein
VGQFSISDDKLKKILLEKIEDLVTWGIWKDAAVWLGTEHSHWR